MIRVSVEIRDGGFTQQSWVTASSMEGSLKQVPALLRFFSTITFDARGQREKT